MVKPPGRIGGNLAPKKTYGFSSSSSSSASSSPRSMEEALPRITLPPTPGDFTPSAMWLTVSFWSLATTNSPCEDSSLNRISLVSRSPTELDPLAPRPFNATELLLLEAMAIRVKFAH